MIYLLWFCIIGSVGVFILIILDIIWSNMRKTAAIACYRCNSSGIDKYDKEFECEECNGTGLIIFKTYQGRDKWENFEGFAWYKGMLG